MKALEKRDYIIKKCYRLLLQKGFDAVSISDIQNECGVARGLLYHYFGNKEELFYEVVSKEVVPQFYISTEDTTAMNLSELFRYISNKYHQILLVDRLEGISLVNFDFLIYRAIQESSEVKSQYDISRNQEKEAIKQSIIISISNGEIRDDIEPEELAIYIVSLIDGVWLNSLTQGNPDELISRLGDMFALNLRILKIKK